jgi:predicted dehydrogenase
MTTATLRTAIIGTSRVGSFFDERLAATPELIPSSHAGCYAAHPRTRLVAGCDLIPERLAAFGEKWGIAQEHLYGDFREMLEKEQPDVVSVCTSWGHTHDEIVPEVARSGVRGIFTEKPLATSMAKANEIIRLVQERGIKLQCSHPRRWTPRFQAVRRLIEDGAIGDLVSVTGMGFDSLIHNGTHATDAMTYFAGDPEPSLAIGRVEPEALNRQGRPIQDGRGSGYVEHTSGVRFYIEGLSVQGPQAFVIAGTAGRIVAMNDCRYVDLWRRVAGAAQGDQQVREPQLCPPTVKSPPLQGLEDLIECLDTGREPICNARRAARFMEYGLAIHSSHRRGGVRVGFPLEDQALSVDTW